MLRLANQDDLPFLEEMMYEASFYNPEGERPGWEKGLDLYPQIGYYVEGWVRPGDAGLIAVEDETMRPIGAAWYRLYTADRQGWGFVDEATPEIALAVVQEFRGKYIGSGLLDGLKKLAKAQGYRQLSLSVEPGNLHARMLYAKMGFRQVREQEDSIVMVCNLNTPSPAGL